MNKQSAKEMAIRYYMSEGMDYEEAVVEESENCYCVINFEDYGIEDKVGAFIIHLSNMGELDEVAPYLHKYINFDRWYLDFKSSGGTIKKIQNNTYIICW